MMILLTFFLETIEEFDSKLNQFEEEKNAQQHQMNNLHQELCGIYSLTFFQFFQFYHFNVIIFFA